MDRRKKSWADRVSFFGENDLVDVFEDSGGSFFEGLIAGRIEEDEEEFEKIRRKYRR